MFPTLLTIGFVHISSLFVFMSVAVLVAIFIIWKQAKEKLYSEIALFDTIILMTVSGTAFARASYIALHPQEFGFHILQWIAFWVIPGFYLFGGLLGVILVLWYQSRHHKDVPFWEILDFVGFAFWIAVIIGHVGLFLAGSEKGILSGIGTTTHPVTLYKIVLLFVFLAPYIFFRSWHEREDWFHKTTGSLGLSVFILYALIVLFVDFMKVSYRLYGLSIDQWVAFVVVIICLGTLYRRLKRHPKLDMASLSKLFKNLGKKKRSRLNHVTK